MSHRAAASRHADPAAMAAPRDDRTSSSHDSDSDDDESVDMLTLAVDAMNAMPLAERRRVYALKGLYAEYKQLRQRLHDEIVELQRKQHAAARRLYELRRAIVCGERDVTAEEVAALGHDDDDDDNDKTTAGSDGDDKSKQEQQKKKKTKTKTKKQDAAKGGVTVVSPHDAAHAQALTQAAASASGGLPGFWLHALRHSDVFRDAITERDAAVLQHLRDIVVDYIDDDPRKGVVLTFVFTPNAYFTNATLTKTYHMAYDADDDDVAITRVRGCEVAWTSPKNNVTVRVKQVKQRNKRTRQLRIVERHEKCESFFRFFAPPRDPDASTTGSSDNDKDDDNKDKKNNKDDNDDDDDEDADYEQEMEMDIEAGQALMEEIVPKAAYYYAGKSVEDIAKQLSKHYGFGDDDDDDNDDDDDDDEDEAVAAKGGAAAAAHKKKKGAAAAAATSGAAAGSAAKTQQPQECKQQ